MAFEQPSTSTLESLQTDLAEEVRKSDVCDKGAQRTGGEYATAYAVAGIHHELRIARLERMIKAEKKRLKAEEKRLTREAAGAHEEELEELDATPATVAPVSDSFERDECEAH